MTQIQNSPGFPLEDPEEFQTLMKRRSNILATKRLSQNEELTVVASHGPKNLEISFTQDVIFLGRFPDEVKTHNRLDLSGYGGQEAGVSRLHARIHREGDTIYFTDLNSKNGSCIDGVRVETNRPYPIHSGAQLTLGTLNLRLMVKPLEKPNR